MVCIRLATYEDAEETEYLKRIYRGRSGELENTVFAILASDGETRLSRTGRGPSFAFGNDRLMALELHLLAEQYAKDQPAAWQPGRLPYVQRVDVGLNVAACDNLMMIALVASDEARLQEIERNMLPLAWADSFAGQFVYTRTTVSEDLKPLTGHELADGILIVEPGPYGLSGKTIKQLPAGTSADQLRRAMQEALTSFTPATKIANRHINTGIRFGFDWQTATPVTDLQSLRAKQRARASQ